MKSHSINISKLCAAVFMILAFAVQAMPAFAGGETQQLSKKFKNNTGKIADNFEAGVTHGSITKATSNRQGLSASGQGTKNVKFQGNNLSIDAGAEITFTFEFTDTRGQDDMTAYWTKGPDRISGNLLSHGQYVGTDSLHSYLDFHNPSSIDTLYLSDVGLSFQSSFDLFTQDPSTLSYTAPFSISIAPDSTYSFPIGTLSPGSGSRNPRSGTVRELGRLKLLFCEFHGDTRAVFPRTSGIRRSRVSGSLRRRLLARS